MDLVVDSNIIISGLITPNRTISKLILNDLSNGSLVCPAFLFEEVISKFNKIKKITKLGDEQLNKLIFRLFKRIDFIDNDLIEFKHQKKAYDLVKDIDKKDLLFVALSLQMGYKLWTGDKKLLFGLSEKGFKNIIDTRQVLEQINNAT